MSFTRVKREIIGVERNYNASTNIIPTDRLEVNLTETLLAIIRVEIQDNRFLQGHFPPLQGPDGDRTAG